MKNNLSFQYKPTITRKDLVEIFQTLISDKLTLEDGGNRVATFEKKIGSVFRGMKAIMTDSDASATYLVCKAMKINPGDEVLVSSFAEPFILETLLFCKAVVRVVDVHKNSLTMNLEKAEEMITEKTRAVIYSYPFGYGNIFQLQQFAKKIYTTKKIMLVEDCSSAFGSKATREGSEIYAGAVGNFSIFSLSSSRLLTAGKGACVLCKSREDVASIKTLRGRGRVETPSAEDTLFPRLDFIPTEIEATLACSQLSLVDKQMIRRSEICTVLENATDKKWRIPLPENFQKNQIAHVFLVETHEEKMMVQSAFASGKLQGLLGCEHVAYFYLGKGITSQPEGLPFTLEVISRLLLLHFPLDVSDEAVNRAASLLRSTARIAKNNASAKSTNLAAIEQ